MVLHNDCCLVSWFKSNIQRCCARDGQHALVIRVEDGGQDRLSLVIDFLISWPPTSSYVYASSVASSIPGLARVRLGSESIMVTDDCLNHGARRRKVINRVVLSLQTVHDGLQTEASEDMKTSKTKWSRTGCFKEGFAQVSCAHLPEKNLTGS